MGKPSQHTAEVVRDLVANLSDSLSGLRNQLAHGKPMLTRQILGPLELVAKMLSQLYPDRPSTGSSASASTAG